MSDNIILEICIECKEIFCILERNGTVITFYKDIEVLHDMFCRAKHTYISEEWYKALYE